MSSKSQSVRATVVVPRFMAVAGVVVNRFKVLVPRFQVPKVAPEFRPISLDRRVRSHPRVVLVIFP